MRDSSHDFYQILKSKNDLNRTPGNVADLESIATTKIRVVHYKNQRCILTRVQNDRYPLIFVILSIRSTLYTFMSLEITRNMRNNMRFYRNKSSRRKTNR